MNEYVVYVSVRVVAWNQFAKVTNRLTYQEVGRFAIDGTLETRYAYIVHFNWASLLMIMRLSSVSKGAIETLFHKNLPTFWNNSLICEIEEIDELFLKSFHFSKN